jgi:hypothetical protein
MSDLEDCEESFSQLLEAAASQIRQGVDIDVSHCAIEMSQRVLAICALLGQADVNLFIERLDRSGTARLRLLRLAHSGIRCEPRLATASRSLGFFAALASGNLALATDLARMLPLAHDPAWEYEDDFLFVEFLKQSVLGLSSGVPRPAGVVPVLRRWEDVLEGRPSSRHAVCVAIAAQDPDAFAPAFAAFLDGRAEEMDEYSKAVNFDPQVYAAEGNVYIEGLAMIEIAARSGLPLENEYRMLPSAARLVRSNRSGESPDWLGI